MGALHISGAHGGGAGVDDPAPNGRQDDEMLDLPNSSQDSNLSTPKGENVIDQFGITPTKETFEVHPVEVTSQAGVAIIAAQIGARELKRNAVHGLELARGVDRTLRARPIEI